MNFMNLELVALIPTTADWAGFGLLNTLGIAALVVLTCLIVWFVWPLFNNRGKSRTLVEPPRIGEEIITTFTPPGHRCPMIINTKKIYIPPANELSYPQTISYTLFITSNKALTIFGGNCSISNTTENLLKVRHAWPKWWHAMISPIHPLGNSHYIIPESWVKLAKVQQP